MKAVFLVFFVSNCKAMFSGAGFRTSYHHVACRFNASVSSSECSIACFLVGLSPLSFNFKFSFLGKSKV